LPGYVIRLLQNLSISNQSGSGPVPLSQGPKLFFLSFSCLSIVSHGATGTGTGTGNMLFSRGPLAVNCRILLLPVFFFFFFVRYRGHHEGNRVDIDNCIMHVYRPGHSLRCSSPVYQTVRAPSLFSEFWYASVIYRHFRIVLSDLRTRRSSFFFLVLAIGMFRVFAV
jgi:hypothetical protein